MVVFNTETRRFDGNAGIAIGPILFIIAILAILAAAIAAGSGSFTSGTTTESNRTKSSALIQIGENLKVGMDRITMETGIDPASVDINASNTGANNALFSPTGGGISAPGVTMSNDPSTDKWYYVQSPVNGFGTIASEIFAALHVSDGVCAEINNRTTGNASVPAQVDLGDFSGGNIAAATPSQSLTFTAWPTSAPNLVGVPTGCVNNGNTTTKGTYFYQILSIQ